ncbi:MipA/OmpV family protein [Pandoraea nosoerga]|uniref:MipA/OmpV family protein n=1 Tax=Pandoraea nosoerga TaxID=2508296 RepID=A0A5E4WI56_9BURK|nr:MipA/OmpV family protein [Pandoraea nosoerga]MBN4667805.1 MipA/OmpV family protein [Pandoraea nosoerga]MBN4675541.1 MipA/OmpV family protein [Pandoraea nosoerga]MBN4682634.1 MipA/OmpV family protein [Pandoraea nosoerga]MBN4746873.1 MipA/OmpV family protein [Pandoraea nosoerga]VVE23230.1 MipA/OmpV family protein [Pandoraea nosoerga]
MKSRHHRRHCRPLSRFAAAGAAGLALAGAASQAHAVDPARYSGIQPDQSLPANKPESGYEFTIGGGVGYSPRYMGSDEYRVTPALNLALQTPFGVFVGLGGVGYRLTLPAGFFVSAALSYDEGRKDRKKSLDTGSDKLRGMGDVKGSVLTTLQAGYAIGDVAVVSVATDIPLSHRDRGNVYRLAVDGLVYKTPTDSVGLGATAHFASGKYAQTYFGVTADQSLNSGFRQYAPGGGLYGVSLTANWTHRFTKHWSTTVAGGVMRYTGNASKSPIVFNKTNYQAAATLDYTF